MSNSNTLSKKDFLNLRSGQTYWEVTKNQFGLYRVINLSPVGKKVKSYLNPSSNDKKFSCKNKNNFDYQVFYPNHKLFWTQRAAVKFAKLHADGLYEKNTVMNIVNRVRKLS